MTKEQYYNAKVLIEREEGLESTMETIDEMARQVVNKNYEIKQFSITLVCNDGKLAVGIASQAVQEAIIAELGGYCKKEIDKLKDEISKL